MICSFAMVNDLMYEHFDNSELPQNLWVGKIFVKIPITWTRAGMFTTFDLPVLSGRIDVNEVKLRLSPFGNTSDVFLKCCAFQSSFQQHFQSCVPGTFVPCNLVVMHSKTLLQMQSMSVKRLTKWFEFFNMVPFEIPQLEAIFCHIVVGCKIKKFKDINYKILSQILLTPKILSCMKGNPTLNKCAWCGALVSLEHILFTCKFTK